MHIKGFNSDSTPQPQKETAIQWGPGPTAAVENLVRQLSLNHFAAR